MRCPKCHNPEPDGSTTCRLCFAPLGEAHPDPDAAQRRAHATASVRSRAATGTLQYAPADTWPTSDARRATAPARTNHTGATAGVPALRRRTDSVAVAALVAGLCALGPLAMLLGVWGRHRVHKRPARSGYAMASVGLWLGLAATIVYIWLILDSGGASLGH